MKKIIALVILAALAVCLAGCQEEYSSNPLIAKWVLKYNDGKSQVYFSFEAIGDLEVVKWEYDEGTQELEQTERYMGSFVENAEEGTITYELDGETFVFGYSVEEKALLTLEFEEATLIVPYVMQNSAK